MERTARVSTHLDRNCATVAPCVSTSLLFGQCGYETLRSPVSMLRRSAGGHVGSVRLRVQLMDDPARRRGDDSRRGCRCLARAETGSRGGCRRRCGSLRRTSTGGRGLCPCRSRASTVGVRRGLPIPGFRLTEVMIAGIAAIILITAKRAPRWGTFDWCALAYVTTTASLVWLNVVRHGSSFSQDILGTLFGPVQYLLLYRAIVTALPGPSSVPAPSGSCSSRACRFRWSP